MNNRWIEKYGLWAAPREDPDTFGSSFKLSSSGFSSASGAVNDLFAAQAHELKAQGDEYEKANYYAAGRLADLNADYTALSTRLKEFQADRETYKSLGETSADVAGAGFAASGSALDILRDSAAQGALHRGILTEQGAITEMGYREQAYSYNNMASAAELAAEAERTAGTASNISAGFKIVATAASFAG